MRVVYQNQYDIFFGAAADWLQTLSVRVSYLLKSRCKNHWALPSIFFVGGMALGIHFSDSSPPKKPISLRPSLMLPQHQTPPKKNGQSDAAALSPWTAAQGTPWRSRFSESLVQTGPLTWRMSHPSGCNEKRAPGWARVFVGNEILPN